MFGITAAWMGRRDTHRQAQERGRSSMVTFMRSWRARRWRCRRNGGQSKIAGDRKTSSVYLYNAAREGSFQEGCDDRIDFHRGEIVCARELGFVPLPVNHT